MAGLSFKSVVLHFFYLVVLVSRMKTIKVSEETYTELVKIAGELQMEFGRPVSLDEAVRHLIRLRSKVEGFRISDLAGSWDISDEELNEIMASLREVWRKWRPPEL